eukprot:4868550-Pleurochrysis_carterae.AAC.1
MARSVTGASAGFCAMMYLNTRFGPKPLERLILSAAAPAWRCGCYWCNAPPCADYIGRAHIGAAWQARGTPHAV